MPVTWAEQIHTSLHNSHQQLFPACSHDHVFEGLVGRQIKWTPYFPSHPGVEGTPLSGVPLHSTGGRSVHRDSVVIRKVRILVAIQGKG